MNAKNPASRRDVLKSASAASVGALAMPYLALARAQDKPAEQETPAVEEKKYSQLRVAYIGTGGIGGHHLEETTKLGVSCPCYCDVDTSKFEQAAKDFPQAKSYQDYREMFDKEHKNFDAVLIGAPDHHHYPATMIAMQLGKHVYTQKPLTHTVWEAQQLQKVAREKKLVTQMGIQGHAREGWRLVYEFIRGGLLGDIKETHTWTDRPIWPQGMGRPEGEDTPPSNLNWDAWLGPAPTRPFKGSSKPNGAGPYHWFNWRGWQDFGCGALGDMACHTTDGLYWALDPGQPTSIEPIALTNVNKESYPKAAMLKWEYPAKGSRPAYTSYWYDGGLRPRVPDVLEPDRKLPDTGNLVVGTKLTLLVAGDYGDSPRIIPEAKMKELGKPPQLLERSEGHFKEWVMACVGEKPVDYPKANFDYAGPHTANVLLGNIALRVGRKLEWDGTKFTNIPDANQYLTKEYRDGWKF